MRLRGLGLALTVLLGGCSAESPEDVVQGSFDIPEGWSQSTRRLHNRNALLVWGPQTSEGGARPNINLVQQRFNGNLRQFVDVNVHRLKRSSPRIQLADEERFQTQSKLDGYRLQLDHASTPGKLRQYVYCVDAGRGLYYVLTASATRDSNFDRAFFDRVAESINTTSQSEVSSARAGE